MDTQRTYQQTLGSRPNWALRKWLAAVLVSASFGTIVIDATLRHDVALVETQMAEREAELDRLVADFQTYSMLKMADAKPAATYLTSHYKNRPAEDLARFDFSQLTAAATNEKEKNCLAEAIYYESRNEAAIGQMAVADVVLNRVASPLYPDSICEVVYQGSTRQTGCQFSFTCDGSLDKKRSQTAWKKSESLAGAILAGMRVPVTHQATHYHANYVSPYWAPNLTPTAQIGTHQFYRFPSRRASAAAQ